MNTVTSVFVEATMRQASTDKKWNIQRELEAKTEQVRRLHELFACLDEDGDGIITLPDILTNLNDERIRAFASSLGIDVWDIIAIYQILAEDHTLQGETSGGQGSIE